jgi:aminomethyltransferase
MGLRTPLFQQHIAQGAKMVDFYDWDMPLHYGSQIDEHHIVRQSAGMFDVSHMGIVDVGGADSYDCLRHLLANDIKKLDLDGKALYGCMLNAEGGILDDLIVYRLEEEQFRIIWNASRRDVNLKWLNQHAKPFDILITERTDLALIAVQGPEAIAKTSQVLVESFADTLAGLKPFQAAYADYTWVARTGYTGEDGVEIMLPAEKATALWQALLEAGVKPCGLGARDTLRLEAGLNLYGLDMDETTHPYESQLGWTVDLKDESRDFNGKQALLAKKALGINQRFVGVMMTSAGVLRDGQTLFFANGETGVLTSGGFSPTLGHAIALARIPKVAAGAAHIERRGKQLPVQLIKPPFVRNGQKICTPLNLEETRP